MHKNTDMPSQWEIL